MGIASIGPVLSKIAKSRMASGGGVRKATAFEGRAKRQWRVCNELPTELDSSPEQKEAHDRLKEALHDVERATPSTGIEAMVWLRYFVQVAENYGAPLDKVGFDLQFVIEETMFALAKDVSRHSVNLSAWAGPRARPFYRGEWERPSSRRRIWSSCSHNRSQGSRGL